MTGTHRESVVDLVVDGVPCRLSFSEQTIRLCHNLLAQWTARQRELGRRMVVRPSRSREVHLREPPRKALPRG